MGLEIVTLAQQQENERKMVPLVADRRLFLDATRTRLLENGHIDARWMLVAPGHRIPNAETIRLGLVMQDGRVIQAKHVDELASDTDLAKRTALYTQQAEHDGLTGEAAAAFVAQRLQADAVGAPAPEPKDGAKQGAPAEDKKSYPAEDKQRKPRNNKRGGAK